MDIINDGQETPNFGIVTIFWCTDLLSNEREKLKKKEKGERYKLLLDGQEKKEFNRRGCGRG